MFTSKDAKGAEPRMIQIKQSLSELITNNIRAIRVIRGLQRPALCRLCPSRFSKENFEAYGPSRWSALAGLVVLGWIAVTTSGCTGASALSSEPDKSWGRHGISDGRFTKPRAIAIDASDRLYVVDMTARIQVFDADGNYLRHWQTPDHKNGCPTGLNFRSRRESARRQHTLLRAAHLFRRRQSAPHDRRQERSWTGGVRLRHQRRRRSRRLLLYCRVWRIRPHPEVHARRQVSAPMGQPRRSTWPVRAAAKPRRRSERPHLGRRRRQSSRAGVRRRRAIPIHLGSRRRCSRRAIVSLRTQARRPRARLHLRIRQQPHPEIHPRRQIAGRLGRHAAASRGSSTTLGASLATAKVEFRLSIQVMIASCAVRM